MPKPLRIKQLRVRAVRVPMPDPHQTASGTVSESPLVLTDVITDEGTAGHSIVFTYTTAALEPTARLVQNMEPLLTGEPLAPLDIENKLSRRFRLLGTQGLVGMGLAATRPRLRRHWLRWPGALGGDCGSVGRARLHRGQGQNWLSDGRRRPGG